MKSTTAKIAITLGVVAGALLTVTALTGKAGKRVKSFVSERVGKSADNNKKETGDNDVHFI
ncbi:MAG: hypothetical protein OEY51_12115 [Cyclobacteriaceae bacterium]|nr:hypothetical protein [Cyclobacteriaceae bacterium]